MTHLSLQANRWPIAKWTFLLGLLMSTLASEPRAEAQAQRSSRSQETALRKVGITIANIPYREDLNQRIVHGLSFQSHLRPVSLEKNISAINSNSALRAEAQTRSLDGIVLVDVNRSGFGISIVSGISGRALASIKQSAELDLESSQGRELAAQAIVEAIASSIPYRGFVTELLPLSGANEQARINLGSHHGVQVADTLAVFEFAAENPKFDDRRIPVANVEVIEVEGPESSVVIKKSSSSRKLTLFNKVAFSGDHNEATALSATAPRSSIMAAFGMFSLNAETFAPKYQDRVYNIASAPSALIKLDLGHWQFAGRYSWTSNSDYKISATEIRASYLSHDWSFARANLHLRLGLQHLRDEATAQTAGAKPLPTTSLVLPTAELISYFYPVGRDVHVYAGVGAFFPTLSLEGSSENWYNFFGGELLAGAHVSVSANWGLELEGKFMSLRKPVEGLDGIQETRGSLHAGLSYAF